MAKKIDFIKLYCKFMILFKEVNDLFTMLCYRNNFTIYTFHFLTVNGVARDTVKNNTEYDFAFTYPMRMRNNDTIVHWPFFAQKVCF
jgi:hypothetical protein